MRHLIQSATASLAAIMAAGIVGTPLAAAQDPFFIDVAPPRFVNLGIDSDPDLLQGPVREVVLPGGSAEFSVVAHGTQPLQYTWYHDGNPIPGVNADTLSVTDVGASDVGSYWCVVEGPLGSIESGHAMLEMHDPAILVHPVSFRGDDSVEVPLTCEAVGTPPLSYRWLKNGVEIASGSNSLTLTAGNEMQSGEYVCEVSGLEGAVQSNPATVIIDQIIWWYGTPSIPGHIELHGMGIPGTLVALVGGLEPVYAVIGEPTVGVNGPFSILVPLKPECTNYLSAIALDEAKSVTYVEDYEVSVGSGLPPYSDAILTSITIQALSPKQSGGPKADVAVDPYAAQQFICTGTFSVGSLGGTATADITAFVTWNTTQDAIVESGGLYVNTTPGPDAVVTATAFDQYGNPTTSNALTVTDGAGGTWWDGKGTTTNTIMGCVKDGSRSPKPPIGGATVGIYTSASSSSPVATMTSNSYGNYSRTQSKGIWCLKGSSGTHQLVTAANQSNQAATLKGYFALWPTGTSIPPTAVLFSNSVIAKKSGSGKAGDPILLDGTEIDLGAIAYSPTAELTDITLSVDGPGGYHTEIDILAEGSITTILEPGDGTGEPGERGDYYTDPDAMVRKPGGVYRGVHFLPTAGTYDFELTVTDSNGTLATDNLVVERAADPEDEMPLVAWPLLPLLLALGAAGVAQKRWRN